MKCWNAQAPGQRGGRLYRRRDVKRVTVRVSQNKSFSLLFDPDHSLEDRILNEQFIP